MTTIKCLTINKINNTHYFGESIQIKLSKISIIKEYKCYIETTKNTKLYSYVIVEGHSFLLDYDPTLLMVLTENFI